MKGKIMKLRLTELLTIRTQKLIIPTVLVPLLVTTAPVQAQTTNTFAATGSMNVPRYNHKTILLDNGLVLAVTGDRTAEGNSAELYNPATGRWTLTGSPAQFHEF